MRTAYLGPEGSFTHQAACALKGAAASFWPLPDLDQVLAALMDGRADDAVAALDSAAGPITATRALIESGAAAVAGEHRIAVSFDLYRKPSDTVPLHAVYGHEKALAQIEPWLTRTGVSGRPVASNTLGLERVRAEGEAGVGAVGPPNLGAAYDLAVAEQALEAPARCETVFVLLERAR